MLACLARGDGLAGASPSDGADALDEHQSADGAEEHDVAQRHEEIELPDLAQDSHEGYANHRADDATGHQHDAHLHVDVPAPVLGNGTGNRGGHDLHRSRADRDGRRNAHENQQRRQQESAADTEHPGKEAYRAPHP